MLKADNYYYIKNITDEIIRKYYGDMKRKIVPHLKKFDLSLIPVKKIIKKGEDFDKINISKMIEIRIKDDPVIEIVAGKLIWGDIKRNTLQVYDFLKENNVKIYYNGDDSFYIWGKDLDKKVLKDKFKEKINFISDHIAPFSLNAKTGLVCIEISSKDLPKFKKIDAILDQVYKDVLGKKFNWEVVKKSAYDLYYVMYGE